MNISLTNTNWKESIPIPVYDEHPEYVDFYYRAWELAHNHIKEQPGMPQTPYMDEGCTERDIWIWDTCFMALFCKYAPKFFPGVESFNNFYKVLLDGESLPVVTLQDPVKAEDINMSVGDQVQLMIHIPDNPPLFAWAELLNGLMTGNHEHLERLYFETRYLQRFYDFFDSFSAKGWHNTYTCAPSWLVCKENGYLWEGGRSGMDNTPRGKLTTSEPRPRPQNPDMFWVDEIAQQGLSALCIARMAKLLGDSDGAALWMRKYEAIKEKVNKYYWSEEDGIYLDIDSKTMKPLDIKCFTVASFWPMLAEMASQEQAERMCGYLTDPNKFGGDIPWPSLSRDDPDFDPDGHYWRGSMWLPTAYMGMKAIEKYGKFELARQQGRAILEAMYRTYVEFDPHTIWECYSPSKPLPATKTSGKKLVRPDFCGWSALGPISILIENVIGFTAVDAFENTVHWMLPKDVHGKVGLKNLSFGNTTTDLICENDKVTTVSDAPYTLFINGVRHEVSKGHGSIYIRQ